MDSDRQADLENHAAVLALYSKLFGWFMMALAAAAFLFGLYTIPRSTPAGLVIVLQSLGAFVSALFFMAMGLGISKLLDIHAEALEELVDPEPSPTVGATESP